MKQFSKIGLLALGGGLWPLPCRLFQVIPSRQHHRVHRPYLWMLQTHLTST